jgi:PKD repeat protein
MQQKEVFVMKMEDLFYGLVWLTVLFLFSFGAFGVASAAILDGPVVNPSNGHLYYLLSQNNWVASEAEAVTLGGHLVAVNDLAENEWVESTFGTFGGEDRYLWIGLNDRAEEGTFVWVSGDKSSYRHWSPGQPDNNDGVEDCGHMYMTGLWNDLNCSATLTTDGYPMHGVVEVINSTVTAFTATPTAGSAPLTVDFTCRANPKGGTVTQYMWDVDGDGNADQTTSTGHLTYVYTANGTYNARVKVVDSLGGIAESDPVKVTVANGTELCGVVEYYQYDSVAKSGDATFVDVKFRVYNSGNAAAAAFKVKFWISDNGAAPTTFKMITVPGLAAGKDILLDASHTFSDSIYDRRISVTIDPGKGVAEVDETNNGASIRIGGAVTK